MVVEYSVVEYSVTDGVAHIELNRPEAYNALDMALAQGLRAAVAAAGADPSVRTVLLSGRGKAFCGGGDVKAMGAAADPSAFVGELAAASNAVALALDSLAKPVVAAVHGSAAGAGLAYVCAADIVIAGASTKFLSAFTAIGLSPDTGASWFLPRIVGQRRALELTLTNRVLSADEALQWGLITTVCADDAVLTTGTSVATGLAAGAAEALGATRQLVRSGAGRSLADHLEGEGASIAHLAGTDASRALVAAFGRR